MPSVMLLVAARNRLQVQASMTKTGVKGEEVVAAVHCHNRIVKLWEALLAVLLVLLSFCFLCSWL
jgi:hypothetical protein